MSKTQRLIELMMTLNAKRRFTAAELAKEFGVSYRTMLRDLDELSALGVPIYSEVGASGGYFLLNDRMLPPIIFTESEAVSMFFAYHSLQFFDSLPFQTETRAALKKFYQYLPEDTKKQIDAMKERIVFWNPSHVKGSGFLEELLDAAIKQAPIRIGYDGPKRAVERTIQPIGLYSYKGFWYCPAFCFKRQAFRIFRADRILSVEEDQDKAKHELSYQSIMDWIHQSEKGMHHPVCFEVLLSREGVRRASSELDLEYLVETNEDGTGKINTTIPRSQLEYFTDLIWGLGVEARIIEPKEAITYIKDKLTGMSILYK